MIIACPSCGARFNLDPAKLLPAGRNVRCAKCAHRWRQMPERHPGAGEEPAQIATPEPPSEPAPPVAESVPPPPEEAETHPPTPPETPAEMAQSLAAIAEQVTGARPEGYTVSEGKLHGSPGANPIARLARRTPPGPITVPPRMRPMRPAKRSSNLGFILIAGLVIGLLIAAYVFRDVISRTVPGADVIYSLLHLSTDNPAADLEISDFRIDAQEDAQTGKQVLQVQATIFNLSEYPLNMPPLVLSAVTAAGGNLEPMKFRLEERTIEPGQNVKFQITVRDWPPAASYALDWADMP